MENLLKYLENGITPYHIVNITEKKLKSAGFKKLIFGKPWKLSFGGKYYVIPYSSMLFAFSIGKTPEKIVGAFAHTDFPCFKIKPNPEHASKQFAKVNVEPYGGMLLGTWFDRPLGIAGKIVTSDCVHFYNSKDAVAIIPSLAPHLDKEANKKTEYDLQKECIPIIGHLEKEVNDTFSLFDSIAKKLNISKESILDYDLFFYNLDKPELICSDHAFISSPRIDNVASVSVLSDCIINVENPKAISFVSFFDHEEIGSRSNKGANSILLSNLIEKAIISLGLSRSEYFDMQANGFLLSVDGAHSIHPNYIEKNDPTNEVIMGNGPTLKSSASQRYLTDSEATSTLIQICNENKIPYQIQVNRSGMPGGSTLGPIATSFLPMKGVDLGIPMLAMHSSRELASINDYKNLKSLLNKFYSN